MVWEGPPPSTAGRLQKLGGARAVVHIGADSPVRPSVRWSGLQKRKSVCTTRHKSSSSRWLHLVQHAYEGGSGMTLNGRPARRAPSAHTLHLGGGSVEASWDTLLGDRVCSCLLRVGCAMARRSSVGPKNIQYRPCPRVAPGLAPGLEDDAALWGGRRWIYGCVRGDPPIPEHRALPCLAPGSASLAFGFAGSMLVAACAMPAPGWTSR